MPKINPPDTYVGMHGSPYVYIYRVAVSSTPAFLGGTTR